MSSDMRQKARSCLTRAKNFISQGDEASVRHACLELRFSLEYLTYQQLQAYRDETSDEAMRKMTPRQVIAEMLTIDPHADQTSTIHIGIEGTYGIPSSNMKALGEDRRFSLKWINTSYSALGNFLHAPTLFQIENDQAPTTEKILKKANDILTIIEHTLDTPFFNLNIGRFYEIECGCGRRFKRRKDSIRLEDGIRCPSCDAIWDIISENPEAQGKKTTAKKRQNSYKCSACGTINYIYTHNVKENTIFTCKCGARSQAFLTLYPLD